MTIPERVNATWIATLADEQLVQAEAQLHAKFAKLEAAEKKRAGDRYDMMRGSEGLVDAWMRWLMVNNETRERGIPIRRTP